MTLQDFINQYDDTYLEFDGAFKYQCQDLAKAWEAENGWPVISGNALNVIDNADKNFYDVVNIPQKGDIVVWGAGVGPYGHIAIYVVGNADSFTSFDQNFPIGSPCHLQNHTYKNIIGYLRPKGVSMPEQCFASREMVVGKIKEMLDYWYFKLYNTDIVDGSNQKLAEQIADNNIDLTQFLKDQVKTDFFKYFMRKKDCVIPPCVCPPDLSLELTETRRREKDNWDNLVKTMDERDKAEAGLELCQKKVCSPCKQDCEVKVYEICNGKEAKRIISKLYWIK